MLQPEPENRAFQQGQADAVINLGKLRQKQGRYNEAATFFVEASKTLNAIWEPDHPEIARIVSHESLLYEELGNNELAKRGYEHAHSIYEKRLGKDHPDTIAIKKILDAASDKGHLIMDID